MDDYTHEDSYNRYDLLRFNKWNRRLLNLYWIFNAIVLATEIALFFIIDKYGTLFYPADYHLMHFILIPTVIMLGVTGFCELLVFRLKEKRREILPYVMTFTCIIYCSIVLMVHSIVVVLSVTFIIPIVISLIYDNKQVLRATTIFSLLSLSIVYLIIVNFGDPNHQYMNIVYVITTSVILFAVYLLSIVVLNRNREIIRTLAKAEHSAYELEIAKSHADATVEARTRFLANMSHEIRTPMNGIMVMSELALWDKTLSIKQRDYLEKINQSTESLLAIVNDILDITKIDSGNFTLEKIPFYLKDVLSECRFSIAPSANDKGIKLIFHDSTGFTDKIIGDPTKLRQALINFLSNAVKFTEKGKVHLIVKAEKEICNTVKIYFEILDTGIGMTKEQQEEIFDPFKQADSSITRRFGGTGLGLTIAKSIIEMMGSKICLESTPNVGSKFSFSITFELSEKKYTMPIKQSDLISYCPVFEGLALLCEDNVLNRQVATESLVKLGFNVVVAENGSIGIEEVKKRKEKPFDIIFMDIHMPVMDGFNTTQELIKMGIKTPIIAMSADVMPHDKEQCLKIGMVDYITKPFKFKDIWLCLMKHLTPVGETRIDEIVEIHSYKNDVVIDRLVGIENSAGSEELYKKMVVQFVENKRNSYNRLEEAIKNKNYQLARHIVHDERGSAQVIGAMNLAWILNDLDKSLKQNITQDYTEMMKRYSNELDNVHECIKADGESWM